jgi:hypothetical protein
LVSFLESHGISQVVAGLHPVTGPLQILASLKMDVMQLIHKIRHICYLRRRGKQWVAGLTFWQVLWLLFHIFMD